MASSYQRLKQKVAELEKEKQTAMTDLYDILMKPESPSTAALIVNYKTKFKIEDMIWKGSPTTFNDTKLMGILPTIQEAPEVFVWPDNVIKP